MALPVPLVGDTLSHDALLVTSQLAFAVVTSTLLAGSAVAPWVQV